MECQTDLHQYIDLSNIVFSDQTRLLLKKFETEAFLA
jgi:hypothetical protein